MSIIRVPDGERERFLIADKRAIEDNRLSLQTRGLHGFLLSKPDDWRIRYRALARETNTSERRIRRSLKELEEAGYLVRRPVQKGNGQWDWDQTLYEVPELATTQKSSSNRAIKTAARSGKSPGQTVRPKTAARLTAARFSAARFSDALYEEGGMKKETEEGELNNKSIYVEAEESKADGKGEEKGLGEDSASPSPPKGGSHTPDEPDREKNVRRARELIKQLKEEPQSGT